MFGQSLLSAFGIACTTDTDQLFTTPASTTSLATYQLNNATTSIPSNTYPGTFTNPSYATGKFGNAASFGGSNYITLTGFTSTTTFSYSFWVNPTNAASSGFKGIIGNQTSGGQLFTDAGALKIYENTTKTFSGSPTLADNVWSHVALSVSNGTGTIYVNGINKGTASGLSLPSTSYIATASTQVGNIQYNYTGKIDQVRIFNTALPQAAVTALYNETTTTAQSASIDYQAPNPNSIAYYKMSDATDQLGNYNGTATNVNFNTEGKFGFAGAFNGSSSYIDLGQRILGGTHSASAWVKTSTTGTRQVIIGNAYDGSTFGLSFFINASDNKLYLQWSYSNSWINVVDPIANRVNDGNWHHVAYFISAGSQKIYVDGSEVASGTISSTAQNNTTAPTIIGKNWNASGYFDGKIDQIRIYDSAISAADVSTLYKEVECSPAAINALDQFNTVLYTGNRPSTQSITGVGFKPDLVWIKDRDSGVYPNVLTDSVRGNTKYLQSDSSQAELTTTTGITSFDSNGFSLGANGYFNGGASGANDEMVAWNWKAPLANLSASFNGSSSQIEVSTTSTTPVDFSSKNYSLSLWVNTTSTTTGILLSKYGDTDAARAFTLQLRADGTIQMYERGTGTFEATDTTTTINDGNWHHIVVVRSSTSTIIYIDNSPTTNNNTFTSNNGGTEPFRIGRDNIGSPDYFNGSIDQVRMYDSALSASEVTTLYAEPAASNNTLNYPVGAGCIAAYPLQTDAVDLSGNYSGASSNVTFGQPGYLTGDTNGTIPSTVATNVDAGFSIVKYTGNNTAGSTVGHGLSSDPEMVIVKGLDNALNWIVYHTGIGATKYIQLNTTGAEELQSNYNMFNSTAPSSTVFSLGNLGNTNGNNLDYIAYCFTSIPGYSKIGSYIGTGGAFTVYTGFAPSFVMIKRSDSTANWVIIDNKRGGTSRARLYPNLSNAEDNNQGDTLTSNGFSPRTTPTADTNINGGTFIYLAIA